MRTRVYYTVEVQVEIVQFFAVRIRSRSIDRILYAIDLVGFFFDHWRDAVIRVSQCVRCGLAYLHLRVLLGEPSEEGWDTHDGSGRLIEPQLD